MTCSVNYFEILFFSYFTVDRKHIFIILHTFTGSCSIQTQSSAVGLKAAATTLLEGMQTLKGLSVLIAVSKNPFPDLGFMQRFIMKVPHLT